MNRRDFLSISSLAVGTAALAPGPLRAQEDRPPALDPELVARFVGRSHRDLEAVRTMLAEEPGLLNATWDWGNGDWETGLGAAAHTGRREIALHLLEHGARIDAFAAAMLGYEKLVKAMVEERPATIAVLGPHGIPLLSHAVVGREAAVGIATYLVARGADVNASSRIGLTPLMMAASTGNIEVLDLLLAHGADPAHQDEQGRTALAMAIEREQTGAVERLRATT